MKIISGVIPSAQKIVIYGPEGIGKSTFASKFPDPLFSDTEGSTKKLNVNRLENPSSWQMLLQQAEYVKLNRPCKTYVIDTADWAEKLCSQAVCSRADKSGIEDFGYGKGYVYLKEEFGKLLNLLEDIVETGIHVVFTAHSILKKFEQPDEMGAYDRYELKLTKYVAPLVKEWADTILFANYKTYVISDETGKKKASGGNRVMYTSHHPCWDAKNRDNLPEELPFDFEQIKHILTFDSSSQPSVINTGDAVEQINRMIDHEDFEEVEESGDSADKSSMPLKSDNPTFQALFDLMNEENISAEVLQAVVADRGYYPKDTPITNYDENFVNGCLIGAWPQVLEMIKEYTKIPF